jgi:hypothetical protein
MGNLRSYLIAGLLVWLPIVVTVLILKFLIDVVDRTLLLLPAMVQPETLIGFRIPGLGFLLSGVVLLVTGMVVTNLLGRNMVKVWEGLLARIRFVRFPSLLASARLHEPDSLEQRYEDTGCPVQALSRAACGCQDELQSAHPDDGDHCGGRYRSMRASRE